MIDNSALDEVMDKLERIKDEELAVQLLREFNEKTKVLGRLLMNLEEGLDHEEWKSRCELAKKEVDNVIEKIDQYQE